MTFELSQPTKHCEHQSPMRRGRICPRITERFECCASLADSIESVEEIASAARQPIELAYDQRIAITKRLDCFR
jgi:hypothetical protein